MRKLFYLPLLIFYAISVSAQTSTITWGTTHQTMDGFGGETWLYLPTFTAAQMNTFYSSTSGIGLQTIRTADWGCNINYSDAVCPVATASMPDLVTVKNAVTDGAVVELNIQPPANLKTCYGTAGCFSIGTAGANGSCISAANYSALATFSVQWIQMMNANGAPVTYLFPFNEPNVPNQLGGCAWSAASVDAYIPVLGAALAAAGLGSIKIGIGEASGWFANDYVSTCLNDSACAQYVSIVSGHGYGTTGAPDGFTPPTGYCCATASAPPSAVTTWLNASSSHHLWMNEINGGFTFQSTYSFWTWDPSVADAMVWARNIHDYLTVANVSGYNYWELADCCYPGEGTGPFNDGLTEQNGTTLSTRYWVFGNWARFIHPGWVRIDSTTNPQAGVYVTAFKAPDSSAFAIVAVNTNTSTKNQPLSLSGFPTTTTVTPYVTTSASGLAPQTAVTTTSLVTGYSLPASSITTFYGLVSAAPNSCPIGSNYLTTLGTYTTLANLGVSTCYYIADSGLDTNDGKTEDTPWAHAPMMPSCASNCAAIINANMGGIGFIFRGGDTWHFGDSSASPYTGGSWNWNVSPYPRGTATNPVYIGVDLSSTNNANSTPTGWYRGQAWTRPIMTADNPVNASTTLSSCSYQIGGNTANNIFMNYGEPYFITDNLEFVGMCQNDVAAPTGTCASPYAGTTNITFDYNEVAGPLNWYNNYIHGWSHVEFGTPTAPEACVNGKTVFNMFAWRGFSTTLTNGGDTLLYNVVDGADSDMLALGSCYCGEWNVGWNVFRYQTTSIQRSLHSWHDNLYEYFNDNGHSDVIEIIPTGTQQNPNVVYNNVFRHFGPSKSQGGMWLFNGETNYVFNNLGYDIYSNAFQDESVGGTPTFPGDAPYIFFNNGRQEDDLNPSGVSTGIPDIISCSTQITVAGSVLANNHNIYPTGAGPYNAECATLVTGGLLTETTELSQSNTVAAPFYSYTNTASQAYPTTIYPFAPTSSSSPTVGHGTNEMAICNTLAANSDRYIAAAGVACKNDTTFGVTYNSTTHTVSGPGRATVARPSSGPWDQGPYQLESVSLSPSSLSFGTENINNISSPQTITLTNSETTTLTVSSVTVTGGFSNYGGGTCTGTSFTLGAGDSCTFHVVFSPVTVGLNTGVFSVADNAPGSPQTVSLSGTGTQPILSWSPTTYAFGNIAVNTTAYSSVFVLSNSGTGPANIALVLTGTNPTFFGIFSNNCPTVLIPGANCQVVSSFLPTAATSYSANLTETDTADSIVLNLPLTGSGVSLTIQTAPCPWCVM